MWLTAAGPECTYRTYRTALSDLLKGRHGGGCPEWIYTTYAFRILWGMVSPLALQYLRTYILPYRGVFEYFRMETKIIGIHKMERALLLVSARVTLSLFFRAGRFSQSVQINSIDPFPRPPPITLLFPNNR